MKKLLFLLIANIVLFARENPFVPVVKNDNKHIVKKEYFSSQKVILPSDARVLKSVTFTYQTLNGSIKQTTFPINKSIDWHNKITISTNQIEIKPKKIALLFLNFYIKKHKLLIQTNDKIIRQFALIKPFRYVIDFKANKNFLTYSKNTDTFIKKIVLGNHNGFYRVVLYLDGTYKIKIKHNNEGYLIEFR